MSAGSISASGISSLEKELSAEPQPPTSREDLESNYHIGHCVTWIKANNYKKVALQFPDELLADAPYVAQEMTSLLGFHVYLLGDTTFNSCCVDEVAASHIGADAVIHFGSSCLSPATRLPVLYTLCPPMVIDGKTVAERLVSEGIPQDQKLILLYDTRCYHNIDTVYEQLQNHFPNVLLSFLDIPLPCTIADDSSAELVTNGGLGYSAEKTDHKPYSNSRVKCLNHRKLYLPENESRLELQFIYIGPKSQALMSLAMRFAENTFYHISACGLYFEKISMLKQVMSRNYKVEQIRDAETVGILVGTYGIPRFMEVVSYLKRLIKLAGKRCYLFVMGKVNEAKVCNVHGIDIFVSVSCPESTIIDRRSNSVVYSKTVTPWEVQLALNPNQPWNVNFISDFHEFLPGGGQCYPLPEEGDVAKYPPTVSLVSSKMQQMAFHDDIEKEQSMQIALKSKGEVGIRQGCSLESSQRTWFGLDPNAESTVEAGVVVEGRSGIASCYEDEGR